jgi:FemAB-related protein (PEP-CTERM system-associated)
MFQLANYVTKKRQLWNDYVSSHKGGTCYHATSWKTAVERVYGHPSHYIIALAVGGNDGGVVQDRIVGVLPLFHLKNIWFGNQLVSLPFCDYGGILADDDEIAQTLLQRAFELASDDNAAVELRHTEEVYSDRLVSSSHKVRMVLVIDGDADKLWKSFDAKLRSQIRKPEKEGLIGKIGGLELLDDFYQVFSFNMHDLGSPVHSKKLPRYVLEEFGDSAKLQVVYKEKTPVGAGLIICFRDTVFIPWASTLRQFNRLSPNMMLYWNFLKYAVDHGFRKFDFGRSSPNEGTYKFKEQWGARATPLYWQYSTNGHGLPPDPASREKYAPLVSFWKKLPLPLANFIGPHIRKHISL